ncbi:hypothetical protein KAR91_29875 [Candidatus Pacearchaeota archaeon]|nr:hypothetical protein [Candidatus Pacearchaeota archaeon]
MDLQEIVKKFVSYDEMRPKILLPWVKDDKVYATNGHILLSFPSSYLNGFTVDADDGAGVDTSGCMCNEGFEVFTLSLLSDAIKSQEPSYTIEPSFEECEGCFGEGEYETDEECDCCHSRGTKTVICCECHGRGHSETPNPRKGEKRYKPTKTTLQLPQREILANWEYLNIVQETMDFFKGTWEVANRNGVAPIHFKQNEQDINIVLMPMRP